IELERLPKRSFKELLRQESHDDFQRPDAVRWFVRKQAQPQWAGGRTRVLAISWFFGDGRMVRDYSVYEDGHSVSYLDMFAWGTRGRTESWLSSGDMERLTGWLAKLPESTADPPIDRTVLVSFQLSDKWRTETYDVAKLPDEFEEIMSIIGELRDTA